MFLVPPIQTVPTLHLQAVGGFDVRITYPAGTGPFPVFVWSHGMGGSKDGYQPLVRYWAEHGYVVVQPTHADSLTGRSASDRQKFLQRELRLTDNWLERPKQISAVIDAFPEIERRVPELRGKLDGKRIAVGGHSFGAHTAELLAGTAVLPRFGSARSFADARPLAFVWISPQGPGALFRSESWRGIDRPVLMISGDQDSSPITGQTPAWRMEAWKNLPNGSKALVWVKDAAHGFGGIAGVRFPGSGEPNPKQVEAVQRATIAFLDAYVKGDPRGWKSLDLGPVAKITQK